MDALNPRPSVSRDADRSEHRQHSRSALHQVLSKYYRKADDDFGSALETLARLGIVGRTVGVVAECLWDRQLEPRVRACV
jgi:hypothetical protein